MLCETATTKFWRRSRKKSLVKFLRKCYSIHVADYLHVFVIVGELFFGNQSLSDCHRVSDLVQYYDMFENGTTITDDRKFAYFQAQEALNS